RCPHSREHAQMETTSVCMAGLLLVTALTAAPATRIAAADDSPRATVAALHQALRQADPAAAETLLHAQDRGASLRGGAAPPHVFVETRERALEDIARLKPGEWDVRILQATEQIDPNGMAHVWARYIFYLNGAAPHCGQESYVLY